MKKLIEFRNIVKEFDGNIVLKGINLDIYENEFVTLLGPSGCGKTTLLRILGGFLDQDEGEVFVVADTDVLRAFDMTQSLQQMISGIVVFGAVHETFTEHDFRDAAFRSFHDDPVMFIGGTVIHRNDLNLFVDPADLRIRNEIPAEHLFVVQTERAGTDHLD